MKFILKIKPDPSKNSHDPSKNKCRKGWILKYVYTAHIQHSGLSGISVYARVGDNEARRLKINRLLRTKDLTYTVLHS